MHGLGCSVAILIALAFQSEIPPEIKHRQQSAEINEIAAHINSEADGDRLVEKVAEMFKGDLPPVWATHDARSRVAHAEYKSATDPTYLIPEERLVAVWNHYVRTIEASDEAIVTVEEIHNLRDAEYVSDVYLWERDMNRSVWTIPSVVAVGSDGKIANGCRALEAVRVLYSMSNLFENVRSARKRVRGGIVASESIGNQKGESAPESGYFAIARHETNPIRIAEQRYIKERGTKAFDQLLIALFSELFPEERGRNVR